MIAGFLKNQQYVNFMEGNNKPLTTMYRYSYPYILLQYLVGGETNPLKKYARQNGQFSGCNAIYQQFQALMPQNVVPKIRMGKVRSLLTQGFTGWTTGLSHRPQHPYQCEVFDSLQQYFPTMTGWLGGLPNVHFSGIFESQQDEENFLRIPWEKSIMKTRSTFVFVRRSRKET